ncbi:MAG: hypothetical protein ACTSRK_01100 [Promethearchaeota archaeon]
MNFAHQKKEYHDNMLLKESSVDIRLLNRIILIMMIFLHVILPIIEIVNFRLLSNLRTYSL